MKKISIIAFAAFALVACTNKTQQPSNEESTIQTDKVTSRSEKTQTQFDDSTNKELKVLLINGSPRKEGNTYLALMEAAKQLEKNGIAAELLQIGTQPMHGC